MFLIPKSRLISSKPPNKAKCWTVEVKNKWIVSFMWQCRASMSYRHVYDFWLVMKCNEFLPKKSCMAVQGSIKSFIMSCTVGDAQRSITCIRDCYFFNFCINKPFILIKLSIFVDYYLIFYTSLSYIYGYVTLLFLSFLIW